jgi:serine/threonine-protein kinase
MGLLREGQIIRGTCEVERLLGEGAFAEVYRVKHRFLGRQAMKVFKMVGMTIEETEEALGEATILSRMGHPNIIRVFDANTTETSKGTCGFFTMEYVPGGSLEQFWRSHGTQFVPVETAVEIMRQVCRGLTVAHGEKPPIIHRDIKPQNILIGYDAGGLRARVSDFGLAKRVNPLTLLASARGTRCFKAPEVFRDFQSDSCAGDVWALGSTLYLLLADRLPYSDAGDIDSSDPRCFQNPIIPPSRLNVQADAVLDQIVFRALAPKPEDRYPSAKELLDDLSMWKPRQAAAAEPKWVASTHVSKSALGMHSPPDEKHARSMAAQAMKLARQTGKLVEASDLMEEALNKWPELRKEHEYQLGLWRRGVAM